MEVDTDEWGFMNSAELRKEGGPYLPYLGQRLRL